MTETWDMCTNMLVIVIFKTLSSLTEGYPQLQVYVNAMPTVGQTFLLHLYQPVLVYRVSIYIFTHFMQYLLDILFSKNLLMRIVLYSSKCQQRAGHRGP